MADITDRGVELLGEVQNLLAFVQSALSDREESSNKPRGGTQLVYVEGVLQVFELIASKLKAVMLEEIK